MRTNSIRSWLLAACWCIGSVLLLAQSLPPLQSVTFVENKLWLLAGQEKTLATNEVIFPGDIKIQTNGVFTVKTGKERQLRAGQVLASDGMLTSPDGGVGPVQDHLAAVGGRVKLVKDGEATPLTSPYTFPDGSSLSPAGRIVLPDGTVRRMLDGQITRLDGVSFPVTDTASLQDGKVVLFKDGGRIVLQPAQIMTMSDGTRVSGDGKVVRPDGTVEMLKTGVIVKLPGVISPTKD